MNFKILAAGLISIAFLTTGCASSPGTVQKYATIAGTVLGAGAAWSASEDLDPGDDTAEEFENKRALASAVVGLGVGYAFGLIGNSVDDQRRDGRAAQAQQQLERMDRVSW